ncbi:MAG: YqiA/YcfP family alpha/beta fold hydrolase [Myxococcota bacterium]
MTGPRLLYLHGFASGPGSYKGRAVAEHLAARGVAVERLDLRVPSFERLSFAAMLHTSRTAIGGPRDRAVVLGSSLGGLVAARLAEDEPRICALVLLAPAFQLAERWRAREPERWDRWMADGWTEVDDHTTGQRARIHAAFGREIAALDVGLPDVRVPTTIVHGVRDDVVPIASSRAFSDGQRHVRLIEVDDGHELTASLPTILAAVDRALEGVIGPG